MSRVPRENPSDQPASICETLGLTNVDDAQEFIGSLLPGVVQEDDVITIQPAASAPFPDEDPQSSPAEMLTSAHTRGVHHTLESLLRMMESKQTLPLKHLGGLIRWPCEEETDRKVATAKDLLALLLAEAVDNDSMGERLGFSQLCQQYKMSQKHVEMEKGVIWFGESRGIAFVVSGGLVLAIASTYGTAPIIAGSLAILCGGVCAGVAEAHQGNAVRVYDVGVNHEECIRLLAGENFLKELQRVETNQQFRELFATHEIPCSEFLDIEMGIGMTQTVDTILGREVAPQASEQLAGNGRSRVNMS